MKKYWTVFKTSWERQLEYRFNFFLGRLRNIIVLLLLYYVWYSLSLKSGKFASYTKEEILTYVFGGNVLRSFIFGNYSREISTEINEGMFSKYLIMPVNYFWFNFSRELAERLMGLFASFIESACLIYILDVSIFIQSNILFVALSLISMVLAMFLYFILIYLVSLMSFWSHESSGPRFLFDWFSELASGAFFPLNILSYFWYLTFFCLPFFYVIYFPLSVYLGKLDKGHLLLGLIFQIMWTGLFSFITFRIWKNGLARYSGEGL